jgi:hypothetical protein
VKEGEGRNWGKEKLEKKAQSLLEREQTQQGGRVALRAFSCEFAAA